ncbi:alpha-soluble NSF attachment protein-like [Rhopilema esculentum]|uniref:alpha-soluble NSF attachment protein-like n=1 Tax=Rhopilema esculentum TaxID=499914 RepID=UPI0031D3897E
MADEERGKSFLAEAEKKIKSAGTFFGGLFGGAAKLEDACDLYIRAGNAFKMAKKWSAAGGAFCEAAQIKLNDLQNKHEAGTQFVEAANCYRKSDFEEAINCLQRAIEIFTDMGRFTMAAKHHTTMAEIYETNIMDLEKAIHHYETAADFYKGEGSSSSGNKCLLKVALYSAQLENFAKAISIYEEVAATSLESSLLKYSVREYFFRAALCNMCIDMEKAQNAVTKYQEMLPAFEDSREYNLIQGLITAHENEDVDAFTEAVREYDSISRLDQWYTAILLRIKKNITSDLDLT